MRGDRLTYFSETVFSGLDDPIRHFLVHSAIFDTIAPKSIARYLGNKPVEQTQAILDTLVRRNLFIHPLFDAPNRLGLSLQPTVSRFSARSISYDDRHDGTTDPLDAGR